MAENIIENKSEIKRVSTYIEGLDSNLEGGIPEGHIVLVSGSSGSMKSSITFNILYNEALKGKVGLYISLEQSSYSILNHMVNLDFDFSKINLVVISDVSKLSERIEDIKSCEGGTLVITDIAAIRKQITESKVDPTGDWLNVIKNIVRKLKTAAGCELFILDSLSALYALSDFSKARNKLFYIFEFLRDTALTSFVISEMYSPKKYGEYGIEDYLADGIIHLEMTEKMRKVERTLSIVKMRATNCNIDVFTMEVENGKFRVLYGGEPPLI